MRTKLVLILALALLATVSHAEGTMVANLLPPPDVAIAATATDTDVNMVAIPVLKQAIQKGETITAENVTTKSIPASQAYVSTIASTDELVGQQAVRPLAAGQPINRLHVKVASLVSRNQTVTMVYRRGGVELSGRGQAMEDGQLGQSVRVINPATRSTIIGTVAADGSVEIN